MSDAIQDYRRAAEEAAQVRRSLALLEIETAQWVTDAATSLLGQDNPRTGKPHSWSSAQEAAKETEDYRQRQRGLVELRLRVERADSDAYAARLMARLAVADREAVAV